MLQKIKFSGIILLLEKISGGVRMPNIKSAKKRVLVSEANNLRNRAYRSALHTALKKADAAVNSNAENAGEVVKAAVKKIDQAASKGILHKNTAARKKSALVCRLNKKDA